MRTVNSGGQSTASPRITARRNRRRPTDSFRKILAFRPSGETQCKTNEALFYTVRMVVGIAEVFENLARIFPNWTHELILQRLTHDEFLIAVQRA